MQVEDVQESKCKPVIGLIKVLDTLHESVPTLDWSEMVRESEEPK